VILSTVTEKSESLRTEIYGACKQIMIMFEVRGDSAINE